MAAVIAVVVMGFLGLGTVIAAGSMRDGPANLQPLQPQQPAFQPFNPQQPAFQPFNPQQPLQLQQPQQQQPRDARQQAELAAKIELAKIGAQKKVAEANMEAATKRPELQWHKANVLDVKPPTEKAK